MWENLCLLIKDESLIFGITPGSTRDQLQM